LLEIPAFVEMTTAGMTTALFAEDSSRDQMMV
jgi:hypothetical protein